MYSFKTHAVLICVLSALLCTSCVREDTEGCVQYALNVQAVDAEGNDLTKSGVLQKADVYLFNEKGFVRMVPAGISSDFLFGHDKSEKLTLVAWGNVKTDTLAITEITPGTSIEEARLQLRRYEQGTNLPITDIFYCRRDLNGPDTRSMQEESVTLVMERMTAGMSIRTRYLTEKYPAQGGEICTLVIRGTGTEIDFNGRVRGGNAGYQPASATNVSGDVYAPPFHVFPTSEGQHIEIDIYRNGDKLCTVAEDNNFQPFSIVAGKQTYIDLDFRYAVVKVNISVLPWNEVNQDTEM